MKKILFIVMLMSVLVNAQFMKNDDDTKLFLQLTAKMMIDEKLIQKDSIGNIMVANNIEWDGFQEKVVIKYNELQSGNFSDLASGIFFSSLSGIAFGMHEAYAFNYKNSGWLGDNFIQDWYKWRPQTEAVFGRIFTWHKVWREVDYAADRTAYNKLNKFFGDKWYISYPIFWTLKNTFATAVRDKFKTDSWWYSFDFQLFFAIPLLP